MKKTNYCRNIKKDENLDPRQFAFRMSESMAESYIKTRTPEERKMDIGDYLCDVVNNRMGGYYKGTCVKVIVI